MVQDYILRTLSLNFRLDEAINSWHRISNALLFMYVHLCVFFVFGRELQYKQYCADEEHEGQISIEGAGTWLSKMFALQVKCHHWVCPSHLVVRVPGYRSRGPGSNSRHYQLFGEVVGLKRGPLSLMSTTEELLGRKSRGSGLENSNSAVGIRCADHATSLSAKVDSNFADKRRSPWSLFDIRLYEILKNTFQKLGLFPSSGER
jgi:hypothetical protein